MCCFNRCISPFEDILSVSSGSESSPQSWVSLPSHKDSRSNEMDVRHHHRRDCFSANVLHVWHSRFCSQSVLLNIHPRKRTEASSVGQVTPWVCLRPCRPISTRVLPHLGCVKRRCLLCFCSLSLHCFRLLAIFTKSRTRTCPCKRMTPSPEAPTLMTRDAADGGTASRVFTRLLRRFYRRGGSGAVRTAVLSCIHLLSPSRRPRRRLRRMSRKDILS